jgi:hypothetical protein
MLVLTKGSPSSARIHSKPSSLIWIEFSKSRSGPPRSSLTEFRNSHGGTHFIFHNRVAQNVQNIHSTNTTYSGPSKLRRTKRSLSRHNRSSLANHFSRLVVESQTERSRFSDESVPSLETRKQKARIFCVLCMTSHTSRTDAD